MMCCGCKMLQRCMIHDVELCLALAHDLGSVLMRHTYLQHTVNPCAPPVLS